MSSARFRTIIMKGVTYGVLMFVQPGCRYIFSRAAVVSLENLLGSEATPINKSLWMLSVKSSGKIKWYGIRSHKSVIRYKHGKYVSENQEICSMINQGSGNPAWGVRIRNSDPFFPIKPYQEKSRKFLLKPSTRFLIPVSFLAAG